MNPETPPVCGDGALIIADNEVQGLDDYCVPSSGFQKMLDVLPARDTSASSRFLEEQRPPYLHHEWREEEGWYTRVRQNINKILKSPITCGTTEAELAGVPAFHESSTPEEMERFNTEFPIIDNHEFQVDKDGIPLMLFAKRAMTWPWSSEKTADLLNIPSDATRTYLAEEYPPPLPQSTDERHIDHEAERDRLDALGQTHGVWHLGVRRPKGHQTQRPALSNESYPDTEKGESVNHWYQRMAPYHQTLGQIFLAYDPAQYAYNKQIYEHWVNNTSLAGLKRTERACWVYHPTLVSARVSPHRDKYDLLSVMVAMTCSGSFKNGGNIVIKQFKRQYAMRDGDVMFLRSRLLEHAVSPYDGERLSFVHAIPENMANLNAMIPAPTPAERRDKKRKREGLGDEDDDGEMIKCPFCPRRFEKESGLKVHLAPWRKSQPKSDKKGHKRSEILLWCEKRWGKGMLNSKADPGTKGDDDVAYS